MKIYLVKHSGGTYEDYYSYIAKAFTDKRKAMEYVQDYNANLKKRQAIELMKEKHRKSYNYELIYETYEAEIQEMEITE